jgi:hypothetical protein
MLLTVYALLFLAVSFLMLWWAAYGRCKACNLDRGPRCGCDPDSKRKPWRNSGK